MTAVAAFLCVVGAFAFLIRASNAPSMSLLYSGLDASSAGEIIEKLESMNIKTDIRGDAIYVPSNRRDGVRMALAGEGLPNQGQAGFELLDGMNGFSTSSEMFDATYWRAREGELARTILSTPGVKTARVHIATAKRSAFSRDSKSASAVVTIGMARGHIAIEQAEAARFIVALAVPNLGPEQVAVIDAAGGVVLAPGKENNGASDRGDVRGRELSLENALLNLLEARVGVGNVRVKVAIEVTNEQESYYERVLDPQQRILKERESAEIQESGSEAAGSVTVASNLPEGDTTSAAPAQSKRSEASESTKFDVSERRRERTVPPGATKRIQVAVLINKGSMTNGESPQQVESPESELSAFKSLVAAAVGFDPTRGDVVSIEFLDFETPKIEGEQASKMPVIDFLLANFMAILQLLIPAIVALILALFVLKPMLSSTPKGALEHTPIAPAESSGLLPKDNQASATSPVDAMRLVAAQQQAASARVISHWLEHQSTTA